MPYQFQEHALFFPARNQNQPAIGTEYPGNHIILSDGVSESNKKIEFFYVDDANRTRFASISWSDNHEREELAEEFRHFLNQLNSRQLSALLYRAVSDDNKINSRLMRQFSKLLNNCSAAQASPDDYAYISRAVQRHQQRLSDWIPPAEMRQKARDKSNTIELTLSQAQTCTLISVLVFFTGIIVAPLFPIVGCPMLLGGLVASYMFYSFASGLRVRNEKIKNALLNYEDENAPGGYVEEANERLFEKCKKPKSGPSIPFSGSPSRFFSNDDQPEPDTQEHNSLSQSI